MRQLWLFWMHLLKAHRDGSVEAAGLKAKLESYAFIVNLHIVKKVLAITFGLSEKLQETCLVVLKAMVVIRTQKHHRAPFYRKGGYLTIKYPYFSRHSTLRRKT